MEEYQTTEEFQQRTIEITKVLQDILDILGQNKLILNFNSMGGDNVPSIIVYKNQSFGILPIPMYDGYDFAGWFATIYNNPNGEIEYSNEIENLSEVLQSGTLTLYAKWTPSWIRVTLNPNGGSVNPEIISVQFYDSFSNAYWGSGFRETGLPVPIKHDHNFINWYWKENDQEIIVDDNTVLQTTIPEELSAKWTIQTFSLNYDLNGGSGYVAPIVNIPENEKITLIKKSELPNYGIEYFGKSFKGWSRTKVVRDLYLDGEEITINKDLTVYAIWDNDSYYVRYYDLNGKLASIKSLSENTVQSCYMNVPNYCVRTSELNGNFENFDHWNSLSNTYADYLKMKDGDVFYNLTSKDGTVDLSASNSPYNLFVDSIDVFNFDVDQFKEVGTIVSLDGCTVNAHFSDETLKNVTNCSVPSPAIVGPTTDKIYITFTCNGTTKYQQYDLDVVQTLSSIEIVSPPKKVSYIEGETFNTEEFKVDAIQTDGERIEILDISSYCQPFENLKLSDNVITITYEGKKAFQPITVKPNNRIFDIFVQRKPFKTEYEPGEDLDLTGLIVNGKSGQAGSSTSPNEYFIVDVTDKCHCNPTTNLQKNNQIISVYYNDNTSISDIFEIFVNVETKITNCTKRGELAKKTYDLTANFNPNNLSLLLEYNTGISEIVEVTSANCSFDPMTNFSIGKNTVSVEYLDDNIDHKIVTVDIMGKWPYGNNPLEVLNYFIIQPKDDSTNIVINAQHTGFNKTIRYKKSGSSFDYDYVEVIGDEKDVTIGARDSSHRNITCFYDCLSSYIPSEVVYNNQVPLNYKLLKNQDELLIANLSNLNVGLLDNTFYGCINCISVCLPQSSFNQSITFSNNVFRDCLNLSTLTLENTTYLMGESNFRNCIKLKSIENSNKIKGEIGGVANFLSCTSLTSLNLSELSTSILPDYSFAECSSLTTLNKRFTNYGKKCFIRAGELNSTMINGNTEYVGDYAFKGCKKVENGHNNQLTIELSNTYLGQNCFADTNNMNKIQFKYEGTPYALSALKKFKLENYPWGLK